MEADRTEMHNPVTEMPEKVKELAARYSEWAHRVGVVDNTADWRKKK
jgi:arylsulfatase